MKDIMLQLLLLGALLLQAQGTTCFDDNAGFQNAIGPSLKVTCESYKSSCKQLSLAQLIQNYCPVTCGLCDPGWGSTLAYALGKKGSNKCGDTERVSTFEDCQAAATILGKTMYPSIVEMGAYPRGCFHHATGMVYSNRHKTGSEESASSPVCFDKCTPDCNTADEVLSSSHTLVVRTVKGVTGRGCGGAADGCGGTCAIACPTPVVDGKDVCVDNDEGLQSAGWSNWTCVDFGVDNMRLNFGENWDCDTTLLELTGSPGKAPRFYCCASCAEHDLGDSIPDRGDLHFQTEAEDNTFNFDDYGNTDIVEYESEQCDQTCNCNFVGHGTDVNVQYLCQADNVCFNLHEDWCAQSETLCEIP